MRPAARYAPGCGARKRLIAAARGFHEAGPVTRDATRGDHRDRRASLPGSRKRGARRQRRSDAR
ncbi:hypothetical protein WS62_30165 [Burkholderia sp. ABCPW 14]|nr:hypothetical protein WS62_30165 [Burkholderia sp. ABCPW 14]